VLVQVAVVFVPLLVSRALDASLAKAFVGFVS
jgi:hypothetical protein